MSLYGLKSLKVKQIVGGSFSDIIEDNTKVNFESTKDSSYYAKFYQEDALVGGHIIMIGKGNYKAAKLALNIYPGALQIGGGIIYDNALEFLSAGA